MSFDIDGRPNQDGRTKINNLVFNNSSSPDFPRCNICLEQWRLILKEINNVKVYWCHGCGHSIPYEKDKPEPGKYRSKYPAKANSFIISKPQPNKKRKQIGSPNDTLSDDDLSDLRSMGYRV